MKRSPLSFRNRTLVLELFAHILETEGPCLEEDLYETFVDGPVTRKTVQSILYELRRFGAVYRAAGTPRRPRKATYRTTDLGRMWHAAGAELDGQGTTE